jgi:hypothetical protein
VNYPGREVLGRLGSETSISFAFVVMISHVFAISIFHFFFSLEELSVWFDTRRQVVQPTGRDV